MTHSSSSYKGFGSVLSGSLHDRHLQVAPVGSSDVTTPLSNTGLNIQELQIGIDYLTFMVPIVDIEAVTKVLDKVDNIYTDAHEMFVGRPNFCGRSFANQSTSPCGLLSIWNLPGENDDKGSMRIALSGGVLKRAKQMQTAKLISYLIGLGGKCNRIDIKADDYSRAIHPRSMYDAVDAGNYRGFRRGNIHADIGGDILKDGWTIYLGSRQSDRYTRYYNAFPQHGIEAFRYEAEFKNEVAHQTALQISCCTDDESILTTMMGAILSGNISFIDKSNEDRVERCQMLPWWKDFTDRLGSSIRLSVPKIVATIQRSVDWIENKVAATLAMVSQYYGSDKIEFIKRLIERGDKKLTNRHQTILDSSPIVMRLSL